MSKLLTIWKENKVTLSIIYLILLISEILIISLPDFLGKGIDGLIQNTWTSAGIYLITVILIGLFQYKRMIWDTKIFTRIYNKLGLEYLSKNIDKESESILTSRLSLSNRLVSFFENTIAYFTNVLISFIGGIVFLFTKDIIIGLIALLFAIPTTIITLYFYKKKKIAINTSNNLSEETVSVIKTKDMNLIEEFLNKRRNNEILRSNLEGNNYILIYCAKYGFLSLCLAIHLITTNSKNIGEIMSIYLYLQTFLNTFYSIPILLNEYTQLKDIIKRLD